MRKSFLAVAMALLLVLLSGVLWADSEAPLYLLAHQEMGGEEQAQFDDSSSSGVQPQMQGWQVYSNEKLKFSILYPDGWFVREVERSPNAGVLIDFTSVPAREAVQVVPSLWIEVMPRPIGLELDDWIEVYVLRGFPAQIRSSVTVQPYQLSGSQGFEVTGLPGIHPNLQYFFATSEQVYRVTISPYELENRGFENLLPDIQQLRDVMLLTLDIQD